jgi:hypothetical protein
MPDLERARPMTAALDRLRFQRCPDWSFGSMPRKALVTTRGRTASADTKPFTSRASRSWSAASSRFRIPSSSSWTIPRRSIRIPGSIFDDEILGVDGPDFSLRANGFTDGRFHLAGVELYSTADADINVGNSYNDGTARLIVAERAAGVMSVRVNGSEVGSQAYLMKKYGF